MNEQEKMMRHACAFIAITTLGMLCSSAAAQHQLEWKEQDPSVAPPKRTLHAMAYDSARNVTVLFGGWDDADMDDTWEWDGTQWKLKATFGPTGRRIHALAYDSKRKVIVLFGGYTDNSVPLGDTWEWDGNTWEQVATTGPEPRRISSMAYDSQRGVTVLFGGRDPNGPTTFGDTWEWDGSQWTRVAQSGPPARWGASMAYDSRRGVCVLFGGDPDGTGSTSGLFGDTWEWDGAVWMKRSSVVTPLARRSLELVYDDARGVSIMYGGRRSPRLSDTWEWDGDEWVKNLAQGPGARYMHAMAFDSLRGETVLFGGSMGSGKVNDTWVLKGTCYADCSPSTGPGVLDIFDFLCFQDAFVNSDPYACDCEIISGLGVCDIFDFLCFQNRFVSGCP